MAAIIPIRAFSDNYIWAIREGRHAVVVDPGDAAPVERWLAREGVTLEGVLVTHHHGDHVGGVVALSAGRGIPVFGPAREDIPGCTRALAEGDVVALANPPLRLRVLDVPGHTAGHIAYVGDIDRRPVAFVGDNILDCPNLTQAARKDETTLAPFGIRYFLVPNPMYGSWQ